MTFDVLLPRHTHTTQYSYKTYFFRVNTPTCAREAERILSRAIVMSLAAVLTNSEAMMPRLGAALQKFQRSTSPDPQFAMIDDEPRLYNGMVILCFDGPTEHKRTREMMQAAYVFESSERRIHHVIALECGSEDRSFCFDRVTAKWRSSAGDQHMESHPGIREVLSELVSKHLPEKMQVN